MLTSTTHTTPEILFIRALCNECVHNKMPTQTHNLNPSPNRQTIQECWHKNADTHTTPEVLGRGFRGVFVECSWIHFLFLLSFFLLCKFFAVAVIRRCTVCRSRSLSRSRDAPACEAMNVSVTKTVGATMDIDVTINEDVTVNVGILMIVGVRMNTGVTITWIIRNSREKDSVEQ